MSHAIRRHHQSPRAICRPPAGFRPRSVGTSADHLPTPRTPSAGTTDPRAPSAGTRAPPVSHPRATRRHHQSPRTIRRHPARAAKMSNRLQACKIMHPQKCLPRIVNCPLQIKPVFYFLFTSIASPTHRIRVKSSLLRLGRSCLALPFTHLGKDIT